jgi:hypothetical protein
MISFFRTIRQKLLNQNQLTRYLVYAFGEILLVVIGILIALQVNNWNEGKKTLEQERWILIALHNEFDENLKELNRDIARIDSQLVASRQILDFFGEPTPPDEFLLDSLILMSFANFTWNPSSYVLNDLKNSGQLSRLSDQNLQLLLFGWERHFENLDEFKSDSEKSADAFVGYLREFSSLRNIDSKGVIGSELFTRSRLGLSNQELLKERHFENIVDDKLATAAGLKLQYEKTVGKIEEILQATQD